MSRRPPPPLLDPLTAADRAADAWLAARGVTWRWPRMQGAQPSPSRGEDDVFDLVRVAASRGQVVLDQADLALEAQQTLEALLAAGQIDANWRRIQAATVDDEPALSVAEAAARLGVGISTAQTHMRGLIELEDAGGQTVLDCVPPAADVYAARPRPQGNGEVTP